MSNLVDIAERITTEALACKSEFKAIKALLQKVTDNEQPRCIQLGLRRRAPMGVDPWVDPQPNP